MKTALIATTLALLAAPAFAGEGNGEPFPLNLPGVTTTWTLGKPVSQNPFPYVAKNSTSTWTAGKNASANPFPYTTAATTHNLNHAGSARLAMSAR